MINYVGAKWRSGGISAAFALAALSISTVARANDVWICNDLGVQDIYSVDAANKVVTLHTGNCKIVFRDGATGPLTYGTYCQMVMGSDSVRQFVSIRKDTIYFGGQGSDATRTFSIDTSSGMMSMSGDVQQECHRAHA